MNTWELTEQVREEANQATNTVTSTNPKIDLSESWKPPSIRIQTFILNFFPIY